jgi:hypothetical protein
MSLIASTERLRGSRALWARRLAAGAALGLALCVAAGGAADARSHRLYGGPHRAYAVRPAGGISVDVSPLLAKGLGGYAQILHGDLQRALEAEYAGHLAPGQTLLVQVNGVSLNSYIGSPSISMEENDYLDGVATLVGPDGRVLATQQILTVSPVSSGGAWYVQGAELRRTGAMAQLFAAWTHRYIPA